MRALSGNSVPSNYGGPIGSNQRRFACKDLSDLAEGFEKTGLNMRVHAGYLIGGTANAVGNSRKVSKRRSGGSAELTGSRSLQPPVTNQGCGFQRKPEETLAETKLKKDRHEANEFLTQEYLALEDGSEQRINRGASRRIAAKQAARRRKLALENK